MFRLPGLLLCMALACAAAAMFLASNVLGDDPPMVMMDVQRDWRQCDLLHVDLYLISAGDASGLELTGIDCGLVASPAFGPEAAPRIHPDLAAMELTGTQWASQVWPTPFAWSGFPGSSAARFNPQPHHLTAFTMIDPRGAGAEVQPFSMLARFTYVMDEWNGAERPWVRQWAFQTSDGSGQGGPVLLAADGAALRAAPSSWQQLSPVDVSLSAAIGGHEVGLRHVGEAFDFGTVGLGISERRIMSIGNFATSAVEISDLTVVGPPGAFAIELPAPLAGSEIGPLDYVSGLSIIFNPDGTLPLGEYRAEIQVHVADYPPDVGLFSWGVAGTVAAVPEPATIVLVVLGLAAFPLCRRRRR